MSQYKFDDRAFPVDTRWRGRQGPSEHEQLEREFYEQCVESQASLASYLVDCESLNSQDEPTSALFGAVNANAEK